MFFECVCVSVLLKINLNFALLNICDFAFFCYFIRFYLISVARTSNNLRRPRTILIWTWERAECSFYTPERATNKAERVRDRNERTRALCRAACALSQRQQQQQRRISEATTTSSVDDDDCEQNSFHCPSGRRRGNLFYVYSKRSSNKYFK